MFHKKARESNKVLILRSDWGCHVHLKFHFEMFYIQKLVKILLQLGQVKQCQRVGQNRNQCNLLHEREIR